MLRHTGGDIVPRFRVDFFHPPGHTGGHIGGSGVVLGAVDALVQLFQLALSVGQGAHNRGHVHLGQQLALGNHIPRLRVDLVDFHTGRNLDLLFVHLRQHTAAGHQRMNGTGGYLIGQDFLLRGCEFLLHTAAQGKHQRHQSRRNDGNGDDDGAHHPAAALLLFPVQSFE